MPGLCRGLHDLRYQHRCSARPSSEDWHDLGRDGSLIMDFSQECFYLATLEDASWLNGKIMTRMKTGALPGRVPSAATGGDSEDEGRHSDTQPGGYAVEEFDGASPHESENEPTSGGEGSYTHTVDSRIDRAATDNLERNANLLEGGVQASAMAAAGVSDAITSAALESSNDSLARHQPPALPPGGPKPRPNPTKPKDQGRPSIGAPISHMTPETRSGGLATRADLDPVAQELASTMQPADGKKYLLLLRLQQQARSEGDDRMAEVYLQQIAAIISNHVSGASGSSTGSSSGASVGMGASSIVSDVQGTPKLPREESEQIVKDFAAVVEPMAAPFKGTITPGSSISRVLKILSAVVDSVAAVSPPHGMRVSALVTLSSYLPEEALVINSAEGDENHYQNALRMLQESMPATPPDPNTHPYITYMTRCRIACTDVIKDDSHLQKIDQLLCSCML